MKKSDSTYEFRPVGVSPNELSAIAGLFQVVWPTLKHLNPNYLRWLYADNPNGTIIGINAWSDNKLAGHYVVVPIQACFYGEPVKAALSLNTAVHPDHQGRGLFTKLAGDTYGLAKQQGIHHVIGVANANSTPGFLRKLEFQLISPLNARLLWRSPRRLRSSNANNAGWSRVWSDDDLRWRVSNPSIRYTIQYRSGCRQILSPTHLPGVRAVLKLDDATNGTLADCSPLSTGSDIGLRLWLGLSAKIEFPSLGGFELPNRLKKSPLNLIVRYLEPGTKPIKSKDVEFEAIDFDAY